MFGHISSCRSVVFMDFHLRVCASVDGSIRAFQILQILLRHDDSAVFRRVAERKQRGRGCAGVVGGVLTDHQPGNC